MAHFVCDPCCCFLLLCILIVDIYRAVGAPKDHAGASTKCAFCMTAKPGDRVINRKFNVKGKVTEQGNKFARMCMIESIMTDGGYPVRHAPCDSPYGGWEKDTAWQPGPQSAASRLATCKKVLADKGMSTLAEWQKYGKGNYDPEGQVVACAKVISDAGAWDKKNPVFFNGVRVDV